MSCRVRRSGERQEPEPSAVSRTRAFIYMENYASETVSVMVEDRVDGQDPIGRSKGQLPKLAGV